MPERAAFGRAMREIALIPEDEILPINRLAIVVWDLDIRAIGPARVLGTSIEPSKHGVVGSPTHGVRGVIGNRKVREAWQHIHEAVRRCTTHPPCIVECVGDLGIELTRLDLISARGVLQNLIIPPALDVKINPPAGIVDMVQYTLQALAVHVGIQDAVGTEIIDLIDVVVADDIADADLIPLPAIEGKLPLGHEGIVGPGDWGESAPQPVRKGATHIIRVEHAHDRKAQFVDERKPFILDALQRQAITFPAHLIGKRPLVPRHRARGLGQTGQGKRRDAREQRPREKK